MNDYDDSGSFDSDDEGADPRKTGASAELQAPKKPDVPFLQIPANKTPTAMDRVRRAQNVLSPSARRAAKACSSRSERKHDLNESNASTVVAEGTPKPKLRASVQRAVCLSGTHRRKKQQQNESKGSHPSTPLLKKTSTRAETHHWRMQRWLAESPLVAPPPREGLSPMNKDKHDAKKKKRRKHKKSVAKTSEGGLAPLRLVKAHHKKQAQSTRPALAAVSKLKIPAIPSAMRVAAPAERPVKSARAQYRSQLAKLPNLSKGRPQSHPVQKVTDMKLPKI